MDSQPGKTPVLFVGHGSPMNAIEDNRWSRGFVEIAKLLPRPKAVLSVSAHWYTDYTLATGNDSPRTIHDFGGFPRELYSISYPAPGSPELARRALGLAGVGSAGMSLDWGLDHGTWSVLRYLYPRADVPVVQLSIDANLPPSRHLELGRSLRPLRDEGVLIFASGNIVHNLGHALTSVYNGNIKTPDWAMDFDARVEKALEERDGQTLAGLSQTPGGRLAHPSLDHYLPLMYAFGASDDRDVASFPLRGFDLSSISMRAVLFS